MLLVFCLLWRVVVRCFLKVRQMSWFYRLSDALSMPETVVRSAFQCELINHCRIGKSALCLKPASQTFLLERISQLLNDGHKWLYISGKCFLCTWVFLQGDVSPHWLISLCVFLELHDHSGWTKSTCLFMYKRTSLAEWIRSKETN